MASAVAPEAVESGNYRRLAGDSDESPQEKQSRGLCLRSLQQIFGDRVHGTYVPATKSQERRWKTVIDLKSLEAFLDCDKAIDEKLKDFKEGLTSVKEKYELRKTTLNREFNQHLDQLDKAAEVFARMAKAKQAESPVEVAAYLKELRADLGEEGNEDLDSLDPLANHELQMKDVADIFIGQLRAICAVFAPTETQVASVSEIQRVYYASIKFRSLYFLLCVSLLVVALGAGFLMQFFFEIFEGNVSYRSEWAVFLSFPALLVAFALFGDELADLINDSLGDPALPRVQAVILTALHYICGVRVHQKNKELKKWMCTLVDFWFTSAIDVFMVAPGVVWLLLYGVQGKFGSAVITGGIVWAFCTAIIFLISDVYISLISCFWRGQHDVQGISCIGKPQEVSNVLADIIHDNSIGPGRMRAEYYTMVFAQECSEQVARCQMKKSLSKEMRQEWHRGGCQKQEEERLKATVWPFIAKAVFLWVPFILFTFLLPGGTSSWWSFPITGVVLAVSNRFLSMALRNAFPQLVGDAYTSFFVHAISHSFVSPSPGEKRCCALPRVLLRGTSLFLLDAATASVSSCGRGAGSRDLREPPRRPRAMASPRKLSTAALGVG
eukprot:TRINITY_DN1026_c0_g2_i2.p1 TRINITY_DN1026_c0_g2~~TRINITY_DN1026_c0_g2_i2.p1  ORF type:complete len:661 (-),score=127.26 TRINITY_DN1026_c0_g2_i2:807-2636(-)